MWEDLFTGMSHVKLNTDARHDTESVVCVKNVTWVGVILNPALRPTDRSIEPIMLSNGGEQPDGESVAVHLDLVWSTSARTGSGM